MSDYGIVAIGYNRPDCMRRLLASLEAAMYDRSIDLIVSIDKSDDDAVYSVAKSFEWTHGNKEIIKRKERMGLKRHILSCGEFTKQYEYLIVFEDDLYVSRYYLEFVVEAVNRYKDDDRIAGIGLYNYDFCQNSGYPFTPINDGYDAYFVQQACSWGQVWIRRKWNAFIEWYEQNSDVFHNASNVPENVNRWNEKSWLKYHVRYCIDQKKYFVFPYTSLTTNYSTVGSHSKLSSNRYQVPILEGHKKYMLPCLEDSRSVYDAFYENESLGKVLGYDADICIDTYGVRSDSGGKRFWLTTRPAAFRVVRSFGLELKPRDANIIHSIDGDVIRLYDTLKTDNSSSRSQKEIDDLEIEYAVRDVSLKKLIHYCISETKRKIRMRR